MVMILDHKYFEELYHNGSQKYYKLKGEQLELCILLLFDPQFQCEEDVSSNECQPQDVTKLKEIIKHFKTSR